MAKKRYKRTKYTKQQIIKNRFIFIFVATTIFLLIIFGVVRLLELAFAQPTLAEVDIDSTLNSSSASIDNSQPDESDIDGSDIDDSNITSSSIEETSASVNSEIDEVDMTYPGDGVPMLVNKQNPIPEDYEPELETVYDYSFRTDGAQALRDMINAAAAEGINIYIVSAYRTVEHQTRNYNNRVDQYMSEGKTEEEAKELTEMFIAPPTNSEHSLGLAVDFNSLSQSFEDTEEFDWLVENCATFGFILRYSKDKVAVTGYSYEPWHYRFVGTNHSHEIMESGLSLEEYLIS